jgi:hypothetical protein
MTQQKHWNDVRRASLGAIFTLLTLIGGLLLGFWVGHALSEALERLGAGTFANMLAPIPAIGCLLAGCGAWGIAMAHLAATRQYRRAAVAGMLGFVPITVVLAFVLSASEPLAFSGLLPVHRMFTLLFVPATGLIAGISSLVLGRMLGWKHAANGALRVGITASCAFLIANLVMEALGWQVGGPRAAERATMLTVMFTGNIVAALAGGAMLAAFAGETTPFTTAAPNVDLQQTRRLL